METLVKSDDESKAKTQLLQQEVDNLKSTAKTYQRQLQEEKAKVIELEATMFSSQNIWQQKYENISGEISDLKIKLASARQECQKETASLTQKITHLEENLESNKQSFVDKLDDMKSEMAQYNANQMVSFSARVSPSYSNISAWDTIKFSQIETNIGNAYSSNTGEFTAPRAGMYVFYSQILARANRSIETSLQVNGQNKLWLYSAGTDSYYGPGSNMLVVHLNTGDKVKMVKHGPWGQEPFYIHHVWSTFSGFLLRSDA